MSARRCRRSSGAADGDTGLALVTDERPDVALMDNVARGEALLPPSVTRRVMDAASTRAHPTAAHRLEQLTQREREVLAEVALGRSNDEVAAALYISPATARTYVSRLLTKLDARDRSQLVVIGYESGLVTPGAR